MPDTFKPDKGYVLPFQVKDANNTIVNLSGKSVTLEMKDRAGNIVTISGSVTVAASGYCEFTVTANLFTTADVYDAQIHLSATDYVQHTDVFPINVRDIVGST